MLRIADNIISSLGFTSAENYSAVMQGISGVSLHSNHFNLPQPFMASLVSRELVAEHFDKICGTNFKYTPFEQICILSAYNALSLTSIDASSPDVLFVLSTTKGNVDLLDGNSSSYDSDRVFLWRSAQLVAQFFGNKNQPIVVSNACISGVCAQIYANKALQSGRYKTVVVVGGELLSKFVISGFQSFKALSSERCKPFDVNRVGLNLGEAAATIIYQPGEAKQAGDVELVDGAIRNDANHISGPSRTGEGLFNAISRVMREKNMAQVSFINAHGTATAYNDEMESIAITRAGLQQTPTNSLKAFFGHTLGAAGVLESIISMNALRNNVVINSLGFDSLGVSSPISISSQIQKGTKPLFLKLLSGFGGSNAALLFSVKR